MWGVRAHLVTLSQSWRAMSTTLFTPSSSSPMRKQTVSYEAEVLAQMLDAATDSPPPSAVTKRRGERAISMSLDLSKVASPARAIARKTSLLNSGSDQQGAFSIVGTASLDDPDEIFSLARIVEEMLEGTISEAQTAILQTALSAFAAGGFLDGESEPASGPGLGPGDPRRPSASNLGGTSRFTSDVLAEQQLTEDERSAHIFRFARATVYLATLFHLCREMAEGVRAHLSIAERGGRVPSTNTSTASLSSLTASVATSQPFEQAKVPVYDLQYVQDLVEKDCKDLQDAMPSLDTLMSREDKGSELAAAIMRRHDNILEMAVLRLRDYVLCSKVASRQKAYVSSLDIVRKGGSKAPVFGDALDDEVESIAKMVEDFLNALRMQLFPFVGSKDAFLRTRGQEFKTALLKTLIEKNDAFAKRIAPVVAMVGLQCEPRPLLLHTTQLNDVVEWYSIGLVAETKMWLSNTMQVAYNGRKNIFDLPWDIEDDPNTVRCLSRLTIFPHTML